MANDKKEQENYNKFVYDLRVNNENRQIQQSKHNIQSYEEKEMQLLNKLKDTMSRHDQAINEFARVQSQTMNPVGMPVAMMAGPVANVQNNFNGQLQ